MTHEEEGITNINILRTVVAINAAQKFGPRNRPPPIGAWNAPRPVLPCPYRVQNVIGRGRAHNANIREDESQVFKKRKD